MLHKMKRGPNERVIETIDVTQNEKLHWIVIPFLTVLVQYKTVMFMPFSETFGGHS